MGSASKLPIAITMFLSLTNTLENIDVYPLFPPHPQILCICLHFLYVVGTSILSSNP